MTFLFSISRLRRPLALAVLATVCAVVATAAETVAVMPLRESPNADLTDGELIYEYVLSALVRTQRYDVIDHRQREKLLEEIKFSLAAVSEMDDEIRAGRLLAAKYVVVPFVSRLSGRYHFMLKLVETETGRVVHTEIGAAGTEAELPATVERTVLALVSAVRTDGTIVAGEGQPAPARSREGPTHGAHERPGAAIVTVSLDSESRGAVVYSGPGLATRLLMVADGSVVGTYALSLRSSSSTDRGRVRNYGLRREEADRTVSITGAPGEMVELRFYVYTGLWSGSARREAERAIRDAGSSARSLAAGGGSIRLIRRVRVKVIPGEMVRVGLNESVSEG
jgi:hypothetical protein